MDMGLKDLPQSKWGSGTGRQAILKSDFAKLEAAILQSFGIQRPPSLPLIDATSLKVPATADDIASLMMIGFPGVLHPGTFINNGLTDGRYRENTVDVTLDFDLTTSRWGTEKASQWYAIYAVAGNIDTSFTLKAMPLMVVKSQATQTISLGTLSNPANGIGYGFNTDELAGAAIYVLTGASRGLIRPISANNNDNTTGGSITYSGDALALASGDTFITLPTTNFRYLGMIYNNPASDITIVIDSFTRTTEFNISGIFMVPPGISVISKIVVVGGGGGGSGSLTGGGGAVEIYGHYPVTPFTIYAITASSVAGGNGGISEFDSLPPANGGISGALGGDGGQVSVTTNKYRISQAPGFPGSGEGLEERPGGNSGFSLGGNPGGGGPLMANGYPGAVYIEW